MYRIIFLWTSSMMIFLSKYRSFTCCGFVGESLHVYVHVLLYPSNQEVSACSICSCGSIRWTVSCLGCIFISLIYISNIHLFILCTFIIVLHNLFVIFFIIDMIFAMVYSQFLYSLSLVFRNVSANAFRDWKCSRYRKQNVQKSLVYIWHVGYI